MYRVAMTSCAMAWAERDAHQPNTREGLRPVGPGHQLILGLSPTPTRYEYVYTCRHEDRADRFGRRTETRVGLLCVELCSAFSGVDGVR